MDGKNNEKEKQIVDAEVEKDLLRSEGEGYAVMYDSEKMEHIKSVKQRQSGMKRGEKRHED